LSLEARTFSGRGKDLPGALFAFGSLLGLDWFLIYMALAAGLNNLWWTGLLLLGCLAFTALVAKPTFHALAKKTLRIDDSGVRWYISGRLIWNLAWDEIASAYSINQYVPDDLPIRGFGLKSKSGKEYNIGDLPDIGPTGQLEDAFNIIGEELVRRGIRVDDEAGWAGPAVLADSVNRGDISPDPKYEGRWLRSGHDAMSIVGILVLCGVLGLFFLLFGAILGREPVAPLFNAAYVIISLVSTCLVGYILVRRNVSAILLDEKRFVLRVGLFRKRELSLDWSEIARINAGAAGEPAIIRLKSGVVYKAVFPEYVKMALKARLGAYSNERIQRQKACSPRARWNPSEKSGRHNI
jgi:hypothetical protein